MDLSTVDDLYEEEDEEEDEEDARQRRRRRRLVDSVSCLLDLKAASEATKATSPLAALLMGTRRSFKLRRRGRGILTGSNKLRRHGRQGMVGSMTNLSLSSSSSTASPPRSSPSASCPPPVSCLNFPP